MRLTKEVTLAINLISKLESKPRRVSDLATELGTTEYFLHNIIKKLRSGGHVVGVRGKGGGVKAPASSTVLLSDVMRSMGKDTQAGTGLSRADLVEGRLMAALNSEVIDYGKAAQ